MKFSTLIAPIMLSLSSWGIAISLADTPPLFSGGDGSSVAAAVVIHATREADSIKAEHIWLRESHPGGSITKQELITSGRHMYDALAVSAADGTTHTYYFDITESFGKF